MSRVEMSFRKKWVTVVSVLMAVAVLLGAKKVYDNAAPPEQSKDCDFVFPPNVDQTKVTTISIMRPTTTIPFEQMGGTVNDASCLNKTSVFGVVKIVSEQDVKNALQYAQDNRLKVTTAGQRHSMGGQSFVQNGLVLDMRTFNQMSLDAEHQVLHVQTGATWKDVQIFLDARGFSVKAMQSINIFTVGGTLSVNAHGIAHDPGQVGFTVRQMHIMLSDGSVKTASPTENPELFRMAIGGHGLSGVILDADLDVVPNEMYALKTEYLNEKDFPAYYTQHIENNKNVGLFYGRLSVSPTSYLDEMAVHVYEKTPFEGALPPLVTDTHDWIDRLVINFSKTGDLGRWVRWMLEKYIEPKIHTCTRNSAMSQKEVCIVSRNQEMYDAMGYLKNRLPDTDILQEYFIPPEQMPQFVEGLRRVVLADGANLLNVTVRIVHKDTVSALPYAQGDRFAFVLYFNQKFTVEEGEKLKRTTTDLIDMAEKLGGTFYLPYQLYYSPEQLRQAYPNIDTFFLEKQKFDPSGLFTNTFYEKYGAKK